MQNNQKKSRYSQAQNRATQKYMREHLDEIKIRIRKGEKEKYVQAAAMAGMSMNKFFLAAANEKIDRDNLN